MAVFLCIETLCTQGKVSLPGVTVRCLCVVSGSITFLLRIVALLTLIMTMWESLANQYINSLEVHLLLVWCLHFKDQVFWSNLFWTSSPLWRHQKQKVLSSSHCLTQNFCIQKVWKSNTAKTNPLTELWACPWCEWTLPSIFAWHGVWSCLCCDSCGESVIVPAPLIPFGFSSLITVCWPALARSHQSALLCAEINTEIRVGGTLSPAGSQQLGGGGGHSVSTRGDNL